MERLEKQLAFALEIDKEKNIFRQTHLSGHGRNENDAEHAWHMAVMAYLLREYANEEVDIARVMLMCLIHDIVEIDAGDTYAYDEAGLATQKAREDAAKERIFSLLPQDQKEELTALFDEFESCESAESRFAHSMDNLQPLLLNDANGGGDWREHRVTAEQVYGRQRRTRMGSEILYEVTDRILQKNIAAGNIRASEAVSGSDPAAPVCGPASRSGQTAPACGNGIGTGKNTAPSETETGEQSGDRKAPDTQECALKRDDAGPAETAGAFAELTDTVGRLMAPDGCPWDRAQTHETLKAPCIEEAAEVISGINILSKTGRADSLREELGDLLLQVVMHALIAEKEGLFTLEDVIRTINAKMIRRHPHVFGEKSREYMPQGAVLPEEMPLDWKQLKALEKQGRDWEEPFLFEAFDESEALIGVARERKRKKRI